MSYRPTVFGTRHAISAGHYLAASAGFAVWRAAATQSMPAWRRGSRWGCCSPIW